jgi:hypothetical protein
MFKTVNEEVRHQRLSICRQCDSFRTRSKTCKECGCYVPAKVIFANVSCPIQKWQKNQPGTDLINTLDEMILESWNKE